MPKQPALYLTGKTLAQLRNAYATASPEVRPMWDHVFMLGRNNPFWYSSYNVLAWLVLGDDDAKSLARRVFIDFTAQAPTALLTREVQFHTHTVAAPLGRLAILYDWIADTGLLSNEEDAAFRRAILDLAHAVPLDQMLGRARAFDNQILSNAFAAALIGTVFGKRHGDAALARRLRDVGIAWLTHQFACLPSSCYSGEGSTYHMFVVEPVLLLAGVFLEEETGLPIYEQGVAPALVPLREWLLMARDLIGPGGIAPGWDAYGLFHCRTKAPLVYLAARERDNEPLALLRDTVMWPPMSHVAWEFDDRLWSLVWWPAGRKTAERYRFRPWMRSETAAALQHNETGARLFQYWDETSGVPHCGRPNVNPNAIQFDFDGIPLLLDGYPGIPVDQLGVTPQQAIDYVGLPMLRTLLKYWNQPENADTLTRAALHALSGGIGESNSLIFDGETWYAPRRSAQGRGLELHAAGALQTVTADATDYYSDRYDVTCVTRTSALIAGRIVVTLDRYTVRTPHRAAWQAFTWPGAAADGNHVSALPGGTVRLDVIPFDPSASADVTPFDKTPRSPCDGSTRILLTPARETTEGTLAVCLAAQPLLTPLCDLSHGWSVTCGDRAPVTDIDLNRFYLADASPHGTSLTFSRRFTASAEGGNLFFRLRLGLHGLSATLNGQPLKPLYNQALMAPVEYRLLSFPWVFDLTPHLVPGENLLVVETVNYHGESLAGPAELGRAAVPQPVRARVDDTGVYTVSIGDATWKLGLERRGMLPWGGGISDAAHVLEGPDGERAFAGVMRLNLPDRRLALSADRPLDLALLADGTIELGALADGARAVLAVADDLLLLQRRDNVLNLVRRGGKKLRLRLLSETPVKLGSKRRTPRGGQVTLNLPASVAFDAVMPTSVEAVYRLLDTLPANLEQALGTALAGGDWKVQMAAADVVGMLGLSALGPQLLDRFRHETAQPTPCPLNHSWSYSKMNMALQDDADHSPDLAADPDRDAKRWRLSRALATALGRIGEQAAIPDLTAAMAAGALYFPALAQVPLALARLDAHNALPLLESLWNYFEINTEKHIRLAVRYLRHELTRAEFEQACNPS